MADDTVSIESLEVPLLSEIGMSSATRIRGAYLPRGGKNGDGRQVTPELPVDPIGDEGTGGPNALVHATKLVTQTPAEVIEHLLHKNPDRGTLLHNGDFHTLVFILSIRLGDPGTTRLINGTIEIAFPPEVTILDYSPKDRGGIAELIENGKDGIALSPSLDLTAHRPEISDAGFRIPAGAGKTLYGAYNRKTGYSLAIPTSSLLEYQGMIKNPHEMFWEIFPPMPPDDGIMTGPDMVAFLSMIIRSHGNSPKISALVDCRVKGNLWGVIPLRGSMVFN